MVSQERAREIMGKNFFGIDGAIKHFNIKPTFEELDFLTEIPWSEEVLKECRDSHLLVAVFPLSILEIRGKVQDKGLFCSQDWYDKKSFAKERGDVGWQLIRKAPVDDSVLKNWEDQKILLKKDETVPTAQVIIYTIIGHYLATGERLFEKIYVRTGSVRSGGGRIHVGSFGSDDLGVLIYWGGYRSDRLGVASARK